MNKNEKLKKAKQNNGITLIALVITIIVLLILAGVTIAMLSGDNSAPQKATEAAQKDAIAGAKDEIAMEVQEALLNYYNNTYVEGDGTKENRIQEVVSGAASTAVSNATSRNKQLLPESGVDGNTITLKTKSYTVTGTIEENGGITWSDYVASTGGSGGGTGSIAEKTAETETTETWSVESFGNLNDDVHLPSEKNIIAQKETEGEEQQVVIPAGFKQATDSADTLEGGIVIEDASGDSTKQGNQFVWVPVNQKLAFKNQDTTSGIIQLGRYDFGDEDEHKLDGPKDGNEKINITSYSSYKATENSNSVARNIGEFVEQTEGAKGYYIGRYEMGIEGATVNEDTKQWTEEEPGSKKVVCQAGKTVYNYITRDEAKEESQNLYNEVKKGTETIYTSDLINSYAWDTAVVYIMKTTGDNDYAYQSDGEGGSAIATGEKGDEKCKIHDMASNVVEKTTEYSGYTKYPCVDRGGDYGNSSEYTSYRSFTSTSFSYPNIGFRPILYIVGLNA